VVKLARSIMGARWFLLVFVKFGDEGGSVFAKCSSSGLDPFPSGGIC
jgi:hypothetical protein